MDIPRLLGQGRLRGDNIEILKTSGLLECIRLCLKGAYETLSRVNP